MGVGGAGRGVPAVPWMLKKIFECVCVRCVCVLLCFLPDVHFFEGLVPAFHSRPTWSARRPAAERPIRPRSWVGTSGPRKTGGAKQISTPRKALRRQRRKENKSRTLHGETLKERQKGVAGWGL